jgi:DinB superfamily
LNTEDALVDMALRAWKLNVDRTGKFFSSLSEEQLLQEIVQGKNRLMYIWGHLTAVSDALIPLLGSGVRLHPELDAMFISNPDRAVVQTLSGAELMDIWNEINEALWLGFSKLSASDWLAKHTTVSDEDFVREPHRNRYTILLTRTSHFAYHFGQAILTRNR